MTYFQACKAEGLRLCLPVSQLRDQEVPPGGENLHGYCIPGRTIVCLNIAATHRHSIYGDDLEEFRPDRWLIDDTAQVKEMRHDLGLIFGSSGSKCPGTNVADMILNKLIFEVCNENIRCIAVMKEPTGFHGMLTLS